MSFKKISKFIVCSVICLLAAGYVYADEVKLQSPIEGDLSLEGIIGKIASVIFGLGIIICPVLIVWGGFEIALAQGDQAKVAKGKQIIQYSVIGLLIIALSSALVTAIQNVLENT